MLYRKKPVVIEAKELQLSASSQNEIIEWSGYTIRRGNYSELEIPTLEGTMTASVGDFIIKGIQGEFYPCKPDIFEKTYEKVGSPE